MAKARIVYVVDDKELKALRKELKAIQEQNKKIEEGFSEVNEEIKKGASNLSDLKSAVANLGLAALAGAALKEFVVLNAEIAKSRKEVAQLTKATGLALDSITAKLRATSKVFDKDFNEILRTANTVSKEFNISMVKALDEINDGFVRGLDVNGEYLDTLREYSTFIKEAGLNTRQFNILIQKQTEEGIFSDKGIDAIKEAQVSIREMGPATQDALKAIGLSADQITKDIQSGARSYFEVIQEIGTKTREALDPRIKGQVLADIFRGAGEDAGDYALTLDSVGDAFSGVTDEEQKYIDAQNDLLDATEKTQLALISLTSNTQSMGVAFATFWEGIKSSTIGALNELITSFTSAEEQVANFQRAVSGSDKDTLQSALSTLNEQLTEQEEKLAKHVDRFTDNNTEARAMAAGVRELNTQIEIVTTEIDKLTEAEIAETEAAKQSTKQTNKLASAKSNQAKATNEAAEASLNLLKAEIAESEFTEDLIEQESESAKELSDRLTEINKERLDQEKEDKIDHEKEIDEINEQAFEDLMQRQQDEKDLRRDQFDFAGGLLLSLAELRLQALEQESDGTLRALEKQKQAEKNAARISIGLNAASAAAKAIALFGPPPSPLGIAALAAVGIITAAQLSAVAKFKDGVIDLHGPGTGTSDSIPAMLSRGESVMTANETGDYMPTLKAIRNREISPDILNNIATNQDTQPNIVVNDYDKLAMAVMKQPKSSMHFDENGFTQYLVGQSYSIKKKQSKYSMS